MPKQVKLVDYLTEDELKQKYRLARDRIESRRWHLLWKISQSWTIKDSAAAVGINYEYAREIVRKYNAQGIETVQNKRVKVGVKGRPALLNSEQLEKLAATLKQRPSDGGIWTGAKVARWIEQETGKSKVGNQRGWDYLKKCNYSWKIPRPRHRKADPIKQQEFKQKLPQLIRQLKEKHHHASVKLWFMDEHRVGLKPIIRRTWTLIGEKPKTTVQHRYEWLYVYSFVHPFSGTTHWYLIPRVNVDWFNVVLANFAHSEVANCSEQILLVLDGAGWHRSQRVELPEKINLELLPPYSPELQPAERLWKLVDEPLVNEHFESLKEIEQVLAERCRVLSEMSEQIHRLTFYHWLPAA